MISEGDKPLVADGGEQYISLRAIKQKVKNEGEIDVEDPAKRVRMKNYTSSQTALPQETLHSYYCALCGSHCLVVNQKLETLPLRFTDKAIVVNTKQQFFKHYLKPSGRVDLRRANGIEAQWRWTCECGVLIGYQGYPYDLPDPEDKGGKTLFYILNDAVVQDTKMSKLIQELAKHQS